MQPLSLLLASASLAAANQQRHVVTVTTYLPLEQHPCHQYFMLGGEGHLPEAACQPGACCIGVKDVNTQTDGGNGKPPATYTDHQPVTAAAPASSADFSTAITSGSVTTVITCIESVTRTIIKTVTRGRTITNEITPTSVEKEPEGSYTTSIDTSTHSGSSKSSTLKSGSSPVDSTTPVIVTSPTVVTVSNSTVASIITSASEPTNTPSVIATSSSATTAPNSSATSSTTTTPTSTTTSPTITSTTTTTTTTATTTTTTTPTTTSTTTPTTTTRTSTTTTTTPTTTTTTTSSTTTTPSSTTTSSTTTTPTTTSPTTTASSTSSTTTTTSSISIPPIESLIPPPPEPTIDREIPDSCPTPTCSPGIQYALYSNPFRNDLSSTYKSFSPAYFKQTKPVYNTTLHSAIYISDDNHGNGFNPLFKNAAAGYRGFLFACKSGRYRFNSPYSDDITIMWFGPKAFDGYTRDNADIIQVYYGDNKPKDIYRDLAAGTYYPIRVLWGNTGGASDLSLRIYGPDGEELSGADQKGEYYVTMEACDGSYPPWSPWGSEK